MNDDESGSVFGGLAEAAGAAWDASVEMSAAAIDISLGVAGFDVGSAEVALATGAEFLGMQDTRDSLDSAAVDSRDAAIDQFSSAGEHLSDAYTDVVGE